MDEANNMSIVAGVGGGPSQNAKTLYKELVLFEHQLPDLKFIADLVEQNPFIPPGFNQNAIELIKLGDPGTKQSLDLAAIIASALSSNLYLNGLAHLDYVGLPANMKPFTGKLIKSNNHDHGLSGDESELMMAAADYDSNAFSTRV